MFAFREILWVMSRSTFLPKRTFSVSLCSVLLNHSSISGDFEAGGSTAGSAMVIPGMDTMYNASEPDSANGYEDDIGMY